MNLSKVFDTPNHDLLIAKREVYSFSAMLLPKTNGNTDFSLWKEMISEVPQGSILDPLLFDIDVNGSSIFVDEAFLSNYANDTAFYSVKKTTSLTNLS